MAQGMLFQVFGDFLHSLLSLFQHCNSSKMENNTVQDMLNIDKNMHHNQNNRLQNKSLLIKWLWRLKDEN